jgi:hypothetical protein
MDYEQKIRRDVAIWKHEMVRPPKPFGKIARSVQMKVNTLIPEQVHEMITESIKTMVQTTLTGAEYTTRALDVQGLPLETLDRNVLERLQFYKKTAALEGAGTGAGGLLLGLADFPLLISIKMKFLFEAAAHYGFRTDHVEERLFLLHVFQLAFSSDEHRIRTFHTIDTWQRSRHEAAKLDWRVFQQEYRDYIDLVKMLQLLPGIGAVVGAVANYRLLDHLGEVAMNCYRMRRLEQA